MRCIVVVRQSRRLVHRTLILLSREMLELEPVLTEQGEQRLKGSTVATLWVTSWVNRAALISVSLDLSHALAEAVKPLVHRVVCLFTPQLSLVPINSEDDDGALSWRWYGCVGLKC